MDTERDIRRHAYRADRPTPGSADTVLTALGVTAAAVGLTALLRRSTRRPVSTRQDRALVAYLRDHLGGADAAIRVVQHLGAKYAGSEDGALFERLSREFDEDRAEVRTLLAEVGASDLSVKRAAGAATGHVLSVMAGGEPGALSLLRTLEALAIGVQGKRCLWRTLQTLRRVSASVEDPHFAALEARALRQWEAIEARRRALIAETFSNVGYSAG